MSGPATADVLRDALRTLAGGHAPSGETITAAFDVVMRGDATAAQIAALLMGLRVQGETSAHPVCVWHAAVFEGLYRALVDDRCRCREVQCGAQAGSGGVCRFAMRLARRR